MKHKIENNFIRDKYYRMMLNQVLGFFIIYLFIGFFVLLLFFYFYVGRPAIDLKKNAKEIKTTFDVNSDISFSDDRFWYICYDENKEVISDKYSQELLDYYEETENEDSKTKAESSDTFKIDQKLDKLHGGKILITSKRSYYFVTYSFEVNSENNGEVSYIKLLVMMNFQTRMIKMAVWIYLITTLLVIIIGSIYSIIFARKSLNNFIENFEIQKELIGESSHAMKTPLAVIQTNLEDVLTKTDSSVIDVSDKIAISLEQVAKMNKLTKNLLAIATSSTGQYYYEFKLTDVKKLVNDVALVFQEMAIANGKKFEIELDEVMATVDSQKLSDCLVVLLENAMKYTDTGDEIIVKLIKQNDSFIIRVADTGIGVSKKTKRHIFDRFYRGSNVGDRSGSGLGLAIAKQIVINHKGKIEVKDNLPKGTVFQITIKAK